MSILYIEPFSGIAGDMFVAALSELASDHTPLFEGLNSLPIKDEFEVSFETISKNGINVKRFNVKTANESTHAHGRTLEDITKIINSSEKITCTAKDLAIEIFKNLAKAEAAVHGSAYDSVHFHEVGAVDAIVDILSAAILLDLLKPSKIISTPISLGQGTVKSAHGTIPVPSPATQELTKGIPVNYTTIKSELTTPTGAAILKTVVNEWNPQISGTILNSGYGAGTKDIKEITNVLRISLLQSQVRNQKSEITVIECNLDDYPAEHISYLGPKLLDIGALDYSIIPATMKKERQGMILQVLCTPEKLQEISDLLLKETSTLGIRYRTENRIILERKIETIDTPLGKLKIKVGVENGKIIKAKPEQAEVAKIAKKQSIHYYECYKQLDYYTQHWLMQAKV